MKRSDTENDARPSDELERLLAAIQSGEIDAIEDLDEHDVSLLLPHARDGEELEDLLDRLRQPSSDPP